MKSVPHLASALALAAVVALTGCGSGDPGPTDGEPGQTAEVPPRDFDTTADLGDHLSEFIDEVRVHRESETNPDFVHESDADRLHVEFPSQGLEHTDRKASADAVQAAGSAAFDFDVLMITGETDSGTWSYMFSTKTVDELTTGGAAVEADSVWESADQNFDSVHR